MNERLARARVALDGLSIGDGFACYIDFRTFAELTESVTKRVLPDPIWHWTDDTNMALSIYENLRKHGEIVEDDLAQSFADQFDRLRGYGMGAVRLLTMLQGGGDWREIAPAMFGGSGSYGNGAAMRIAPLGAYFADDFSAVVENARRASSITHAHPEGIAGGIAVAVAAAVAANHPNGDLASNDFFAQVLPHVPDSDVKKGILSAQALPADTGILDLVRNLGNGSLISAQDTVPLVIWMAAHHLYDFEGALWHTANCAGDMDTTCAMVGGIVASAVGAEGIPAEWLQRREPLPKWAFED